MSNEKIKFKTVTPPTKEGGWANATLDDGREVSIAPDKWVALNPKPESGSEGEYDVYKSPTNGKIYIQPAKVSKGGQRDNSGMAIGAALNNAVQLISSGKIELKDLKTTAKRILDISIELKDEYKNKL